MAFGAGMMAGGWDGHTYRGDDTSERVVGKAAAEYILGEGGADTLLGGGGNDVIRGGAGRDVIDGGAGRDVIQGALGDRIRGGVGNDWVMIGNDPEDAVRGARVVADGGSGNDLLSFLYVDERAEGVRFIAENGAFSVRNGGDVVAKINGFESYALRFDGNGDDFVRLGSGDDVVYTQGGDDTISAGDGDDEVRAGTGRFDARGGAGDDLLTFDLSDRTSGVKLTVDGPLKFSGNTAVGFEHYGVTGTNFADRLTGGSGSDSLSGGNGADTLDGGAGDDFLYDEEYSDDRGSDLLIGRGGADLLVSYGGADRLKAGSGDDRVVVNLDPGADTAKGGAGDDQLTVQSRGASTEGGQTMVARTVDGVFVVTLDGETVLKATGFESFQLYGGKQGDVLSGRGGDDLFYGAEGVDTLDGGRGSDVFYLSTERQAVIVRLDGDQSVTTVSGQTVDEISGMEDVYATNFDDVIVGNDAANRIVGGIGSDTATGGGGKDVFVVRLMENVFTPGDEADTIGDFASGTDRLELDNFAHNDIERGDIAPGSFRLGSKALDGDDRYIYDRPSGQLFFDEDGAGGEAQHLIANLGAGTRLVADDLFVGGG